MTTKPDLGYTGWLREPNGQWTAVAWSDDRAGIDSWRAEEQRWQTERCPEGAHAATIAITPANETPARTDMEHDQ